nr:MAG TPA: hypothetical protein [Caudoviricetes sp.]
MAGRTPNHKKTTRPITADGSEGNGCCRLCWTHLYYSTTAAKSQDRSGIFCPLVGLVLYSISTTKARQNRFFKEC